LLAAAPHATAGEFFSAISFSQISQRVSILFHLPAGRNICLAPVVKNFKLKTPSLFLVFTAAEW